jgi:predicted transcriptional regulator
MASDLIKLTADIVMSHASMTELSPMELVDEIKCIHSLLSSFDDGPESPVALGKRERAVQGMWQRNRQSL